MRIEYRESFGKVGKGIHIGNRSEERVEGKVKKGR